MPNNGVLTLGKSGSAGALITIDGSYGEGGGALLRTALCMSSITQQGVIVRGVRTGTRFAGLDAEDLTLLNALSRMCAAEVSGAELGSSSLEFVPTRRPASFNGLVPSVRSESGRGANAPVILTSLLPVLARTGTYASLEVDGETFGSNSLSYDYFANITLHAQRAFGLYAYPTLESAGFGRESSGEVTLDVEPSALVGIQWQDRGRLLSLRAVVSTAGGATSAGDRAIGHLRRLAQSANLPLDATHVNVPSASTGSFVTTWATYERGIGGGAAMGSRGLRVEAIAQSAFTQMFEWMTSGATIDPFLADQILLTAVLAEGETNFKVSKITQRFLTAVWVIKQFTPIHITIRGNLDSAGTITIRR